MTPAIAYHLAATCIRCGGRLNHIAGGATDGYRTAALVQCQHCRCQMTVEVKLTPDVDLPLPDTWGQPIVYRDDDGIEHGHHTAYHRCTRAYDVACDPCRTAKRAEERRRK